MSYKKDRVIKIIESLRIFYGYEIKKIYEKVYREKISAQHIYKIIKSLIEEGLLINIFEEEIKGKFSWGNLSRRKFFLYIGKSCSEKNKKIEKECEKYLRELIKGVSKDKLTIVRNVIKSMADFENKEKILKEIEEILK